MGCALGARISGTYPCTLIILSAFSAPFCPRCLSLAAYFSDQRAPVLRMHSEKLLVPHIQFVNDGFFEVFVVSLQIFLAHFLRVEYMYFRLPVVYMPGKRGDKIRTELVFKALLRDKAHVVLIPAGHCHKAAVIWVGVVHLLFEALLHQPGAVSPRVYEAVRRLYHYHGQYVRLELPGLIHIGASYDTVLNVDSVPCREVCHERSAQRAAVGGADPAAVVVDDVLLYFLKLVLNAGVALRVLIIKAGVREAATRNVFLSSSITLPKLPFQ